MVVPIAWAGLGTVVTFMGASVPLWVFLLIIIGTALLKPTVLKYVLGIFVLLFVATFTDITLKAMFWIGVIILILWILTRKK